MPEDGDLQVWWVPQVPMKAFKVNVRTLREARLLLDTLAQYDKFQFDNRVKPDYCNAGGLNVYAEELNDPSENCDGWSTWYHPDTGEDFDDVSDVEIEILDRKRMHKILENLPEECD